MKISKIELSWFRGAGETIELVTQGRSVAVYGANGAGKSCFVDAIEYALRGGRIEHLVHEYSGKRQERAVLNTHKPGDATTWFAISLSGGARHKVSIAESGAFEVDTAGSDDFLELDCGRTVLRQDEVSRFIHSTKGEKYSVLLPLLGLGHMETAAENFRQLAKAILKRSGASEAAAALRQAQRSFAQAFDDDAPETADKAIQELCETFVASEHEHAPEECSGLVAAELEKRLADSSALERQQVALEGLATVDLRGATEGVRSKATDLAEVAGAALLSQLKVLQATEQFLKTVEEEAVVCPACGTSVLREAMGEHVVAEMAHLRDAREKAAKYKDSVASFIGLADKVVAGCKSEAIQRWVNAATDTRIRPIIDKASTAIVPRDGVSDAELADLDDVLGAAIMVAVAAASFLPPPVPDLARAQERLSAAQQLRSAEKRAASGRSAELLSDRVKQAEADVRDEIRRQSAAIIAGISADIQRMWEVLHPGEPIEDVRLHVPPDSEKAIDIALKFYGKELTSPRLTLSEGYRNSLGLCVFLAMAARYGDGSTPVVLDDVIVSLDRGHRGMVVDLLESEFSERQVLLFTHDRDWHIDLRQQLSGAAWTFRNLLPYSDPTEGVRWSERTSSMDDARAYLSTRPDTAANEARKTMDVELAIHSERLELELPYARGARNDRRTAHDFLVRLIKGAEKRLWIRVDGSHEQHSEAIVAFKAADRLLLTWANRGSHSEDVTPGEAEKLISACETALAALVCDDCGKLVSHAETTGGLHQCECGTLRWK